MITAGLGRFGPYIKHGSNYVSLKEDDVLTVGLNRAVALIAESPGHNAIELGAHPEDGKPISVRKGRYGHYVKHGRANATVPKDIDPESLTLDEAVALLAEKAAKSKSKKTAAKSEPAPKRKKTELDEASGAKKATKGRTSSRAKPARRKAAPRRTKGSTPGDPDESASANG